MCIGDHAVESLLEHGMERLCEARPKGDVKSKYCMWCGLAAFDGDGVSYLAGVLVAHDCCIPGQRMPLIGVTPNSWNKA